MASYDLSRALETGMQTYPGDPAVSVTDHAEFDADGYRVTALSMGSHTGTHVDAPSHTVADGETLGAYPVETFRFDAHLADVRRGARAPIRVADLPAATGADLLVLRTGWDDHWGTDRALDHPYLTAAAADWCVDHGYHVATDALNVDPTPGPNAAADEPSGFPAHAALLGAGRLIYENLRGLDRLPTRFRLHAYPLALDADGAPVRAVAVTDD
jgi:kynurenine formamidase